MSPRPEVALWVSTDAHLHAGTRLRWRLHPARNRATVTVEGAGLSSVTLYAERPELVRLRDALNEALAGLDTEAGTAG